MLLENTEPVMGQMVTGQMATDLRVINYHAPLFLFTESFIGDAEVRWASLQNTDRVANEGGGPQGSQSPKEELKQRTKLLSQLPAPGQGPEFSIPRCSWDRQDFFGCVRTHSSVLFKICSICT